jgi:hypothetical protein
VSIFEHKNNGQRNAVMVNDITAPYWYDLVYGTVKSSVVSTGTAGSQSDLLLHRISCSSFRVLSEMRRELVYTATPVQPSVLRMNKNRVDAHLPITKCSPKNTRFFGMASH